MLIAKKQLSIFLLPNRIFAKGASNDELLLLLVSNVIE